MHDMRCQLCHGPVSNPKAKMCEKFCLPAIIFLVFPFGLVIGMLLGSFGWYYFFVPYVVFCVAIAVRRTTNRVLGDKAEAANQKLELVWRIIGAGFFIVLIPFAFFFLALGPFHLVTLLPEGPKRGVIFAVISVLVVGECLKDGINAWKGK